MKVTRSIELKRVEKVRILITGGNGMLGRDLSALLCARREVLGADLPELERARQGNPLRVVDDQIGAPTYTVDLAENLERIVMKGKPGIYHATNHGYCSWFEFAGEILRQAGLCHIPLTAIPTSASDRPALRPRNSRLAHTRLESEGLGLLPPWQDALKRSLDRERQARSEGESL
jgi:dTDP-4-dehydrorhamnose reductase